MPSRRKSRAIKTRRAIQGPRNDGGEGNMIYRVVSVDEEEVFADGNHPLAGVELHFSIDIVEVREATAEELAQATGAAADDCEDGGCECC